MGQYLDTIQYVTSGLSLVAFVAALLLGAYTARLRNRERMLNSIPAKERIRATESVAREIGLGSLDDLTPERKYDLVREELHQRARTRLLYTIMALVVTGVLGALAWVSIERAPQPEPTPESATAPPEEVSEVAAPETRRVATTFCMGTYANECPYPYDIFVACYSFDPILELWVRANDCLSEPTQRNDKATSGNRCGYSEIVVECEVPA